MAKIQRYFSLFILLAVIFTVGSFAAADNRYTTENDPLVSLSYVQDLKKEIVNDLYEKVDAGKLGEYLNSSEFGFKKLKKGQQLAATGSCEIILRSGAGTAVILDPANVAAGVGFSDLTAGAEVKNGESVQTNHLLLASAGDGRLITVTSSTAYFMIRGDYTIVG